eukprot:CAMPEP_0202857080 /NCGR_PEP_ID=MMETSP1391-20130828/155_1 /ASSEMBLY_ACC=CAM_ASM_000867 /TAXON_ID=1034604 /ORGANISM="Chlamydomonas leiostraca, Strain SAG 11-49" /LENGTH=42 /DNA_ID= /DNA_START= /DNA_END= /DNA_ORIENTATION=
MTNDLTALRAWAWIQHMPRELQKAAQNSSQMDAPDHHHRADS